MLPTLSSGSLRSLSKFRQLVYAFLAGADCLDDCEHLAEDPGFQALCGPKTYSAKALGDFLRTFSHQDCRNLNYRLIEQAYRLREQLPASESLTIDLDSTIIKQCGKKMEGLGTAYNGVWGLDCIQAYDDMGLQYWHEVRPGGTYSSQGAELIIHEKMLALSSP